MTQKELLKNLKVSSTDKTQIIKIEMEDPSYEKAVAMTKTLADTFMSEVPTLMNMNNVKILSSSDVAVKPLPANASIVINLALSFILSAMAAIGVFFFLKTSMIRFALRKRLNTLRAFLFLLPSERLRRAEQPRLPKR